MSDRLWAGVWGVVLAVGVVLVAAGGWWVLLGAFLLGQFAARAVAS